MHRGNNQFMLIIRLGNSAMRDQDDVAQILRTVADGLAQSCVVQHEGILHDRNGNRVGSFVAQYPED